jgi:hypothetical protein
VLVFERALDIYREVFKLCSASSEKYGPWELDGLANNVAEMHIATDCSSGDNVGGGESEGSTLSIGRLPASFVMCVQDITWLM